MAAALLQIPQIRKRRLRRLLSRLRLHRRIQQKLQPKETELDVLKIGLAALPTQLDPDRSIGIASIKLFYNIFDTLLFTDKEGNITGQLADSWEWQEDTTLNVKIREKVTFQNGEVCDAEDVKFTFDRILSG